MLFRVCHHHVYASVLASDRYVDGDALLSGSRSAAVVRRIGLGPTVIAGCAGFSLPLPLVPLAEGSPPAAGSP
ncbi:hypothetical protein [Streptomyces sp. CNQ-509]|uniref:hypothetical protein n=1 Tax=Streptomyces sp. CNQ-509 TaxID=444103 RepID=UPI00069BC0FC|nr:hypothetical protein [Streptomyces sp. CNQ-509]